MVVKDENSLNHDESRFFEKMTSLGVSILFAAGINSKYERQVAVLNRAR